MRILISNGEKTDKLIGAVEEGFDKGVMSFLKLEDITTLEKLYVRGETFDKAYILKSALDYNNLSDDEDKLREALVNISKVVKNKYGNIPFVFVATDEKMAQLITEETYLISDNSRVLCIEPPFKVAQMCELMQKDISEIDKSLIYNSKYAETENANSEWSIAMLDNSEETYDDFDEEKLEENEIIDEELENFEDGEEELNDFEDLESDEEELNDFDNFDEETLEENEEESLEENINEDDFDDISFDFDEDDNDDMVNENDDDFDESDSETDEDDDTIEDLTTEEELDFDEEENVEENDTFEEDFDFENEEDNENELNDFDDILKNGTTNYSNFEEKSLKNEINDFEDDIEDKAELENLFDTKNQKEGYDISEQLFDEINEEQTNKQVEEMFDTNVYVQKQDNIDLQIIKKFNVPKMVNIELDEKAKVILQRSKKKALSFVVTGANGAGKTIFAYNLANTLQKAGLDILIVDFDTINRMQSFLTSTAYNVTHSVDTANNNLEIAFKKGGSGLGHYTHILKQGLHLLNIGLACDNIALDNISKENIIKLLGTLTKTYDAIVYDIPFNNLERLSIVVNNSDYITAMIENNTYSMMQLLLAYSNIDNEELRENLFKNTQVCFNKVKANANIMGMKIKYIGDYLKALDVQIVNLLGTQGEYLFGNLKICGAIEYMPEIEDFWFSKYNFSDTQEGSEIMSNILNSML